MITPILFTILTILKVGSSEQESSKLHGITIDGHRNRIIAIDVVIKGTTIASISDACGRFTIPIKSEKFVLVFHGMSYDDLRTYEIQLSKKDLISDTLIFQLGHWKVPNPNCDKVERKSKIYVVE